eukprot:31356-Pelagococcus_subviridis.AAC.5
MAPPLASMTMELISSALNAAEPPPPDDGDVDFDFDFDLVVVVVDGSARRSHASTRAPDAQYSACGRVGLNATAFTASSASKHPVDALRACAVTREDGARRSKTSAVARSPPTTMVAPSSCGESAAQRSDPTRISFGAASARVFCMTTDATARGAAPSRARLEVPPRRARARRRKAHLERAAARRARSFSLGRREAGSDAARPTTLAASIGVHHANAVVWEPVYRTHLQLRQPHGERQPAIPDREHDRGVPGPPNVQIQNHRGAVRVRALVAIRDVVHAEQVQRLGPELELFDSQRHPQRRDAREATREDVPDRLRQRRGEPRPQRLDRAVQPHRRLEVWALAPLRDVRHERAQAAHGDEGVGGVVVEQLGRQHPARDERLLLRFGALDPLPEGEA